MRIEHIATATDVGRTRDNNEDCVLRLDDLPLFAVADGMGGAEAGEVASALAVAALTDCAPTIQRALRAAGEAGTDAARAAAGRVLEDAFLAAHARVEATARSRRLVGMGTTLIALTFVGGRALVAHVGDSRAYLFRDGVLRPLTQDHSIAMIRYQRGQLSEAELRTHPDQHRLYQAIGCGTELDVDIAEVELADQDVLLLCSDGLSGPLTDDDIAGILAQGQPLDAAAAALIAEANASGGPDNVSLVLVSVAADRPAARVQALCETIRTNFLFRGLSDAELAVIVPYLQARSLPAGAVLAVEDEPAHEFYVLAEGTVRITRGATWLIDVGPGGHFGELALAQETTRTATATAITPVELVALSREDFRLIARRRPALAARLSLALLDAVGHRLRDLTDRLDAVVRAASGIAPR